MVFGGDRRRIENRIIVVAVVPVSTSMADPWVYAGTNQKISRRSIHYYEEASPMMNTLKQWLDRNTAYGLGAIAVLHGIAWAVQHSAWSAIPMALIAIALLVITSRSLDLGFFACDA